MKNIKNVMMLLLMGLFLGCVSVRADVIYEPSLQSMLGLDTGELLWIGLAVAAIVFVIVSLLVYLKRRKKKSQSLEKAEKF